MIKKGFPMKKQAIQVLKQEIIPDLKNNEYSQTDSHYANDQANEIYQFFEEIHHKPNFHTLLWEELNSRYFHNLQHPEKKIKKLYDVLLEHPPLKKAA